MQKIIVYSLLSLLTACELFPKADEPKTELEKLPPITQTGENTFGCLVNGKAFVVTNTSGMSAIYQGGGFSVSGEIDNSKTDENVSIFLGNLIESGVVYDLHNSSTRHGDYNNQVKNCIYHTDENFRGFIKISYLNMSSFIVSGTFEFEAYSTDCLDTIKITNGRFDMRYIP